MLRVKLKLLSNGRIKKYPNIVGPIKGILPK